MAVTSILFFGAFALIVCALPLVGWILVKERSANFHRMWEFAIAGHKLAQVYLAIVGLAFALAVTGWVLAFVEQKTEKNAAITVPNQTFKRTPDGAA